MPTSQPSGKGQSFRFDKLGVEQAVAAAAGGGGGKVGSGDSDKSEASKA